MNNDADNGNHHHLAMWPVIYFHSMFSIFRFFFVIQIELNGCMDGCASFISFFLCFVSSFIRPYQLLITIIIIIIVMQSKDLPVREKRKKLRKTFLNRIINMFF